MKTNKFKNKDGSLTQYAFLCGYDMTKNGRVMADTIKGIKKLINQNL